MQTPKYTKTNNTRPTPMKIVCKSIIILMKPPSRKGSLREKLSFATNYSNIDSKIQLRSHLITNPTSNIKDNVPKHNTKSCIFALKHFLVSFSLETINIYDDHTKNLYISAIIWLAQPLCMTWTFTL